ncbi:MAG TPA: hypothetical protein VJS92_07220 [Candidatus Polarisedimenticolaceae bacterium]|nr:hypothetical protein [Candidatus Polarisedimenticolaceae bacterium]
MSDKKLPSRSASERWCRRVGAWGLFVWLLGGVLLEALHGFKLAAYLEDPLRREMWTLAHAHGTLLSLTCLVLAWAGPLAALAPRRARACDRLLAAGAVLLPLGFLLGGIVHSEADPGPGILLVPVGGLLAAAGLALVAVAWRQPDPGR